MKRSRLWIGLAVTGMLWSVAGAARGDERLIVGADVGGTGALSPMRDFVKPGAVLSPFVGYMFNEYLGGLAQMQILGIPTKRDPRVLYEDDVCWVYAATIGPRIAFPVGDWEWYGTYQMGVFTGLSPHSPVSDTSWGLSAGGGVNYILTDEILLGGFGRYNWTNQAVHYLQEVQYATGGISFTYRMPPPSLTEVPSAADPK